MRSGSKSKFGILGFWQEQHHLGSTVFSLTLTHRVQTPAPEEGGERTQLPRGKAEVGIPPLPNPPLLLTLYLVLRTGVPSGTSVSSV